MSVQRSGGPVILIGFALGVNAVASSGGSHFNSTHRRLGLVLFIFYLALQLPSGAIIHFFKPRSFAERRPLQNYAHAWFGLLILALAFWQVWLGFQREWFATTGRHRPRGVWVAWVIWTVVRHHTSNFILTKLN